MSREGVYIGTDIPESDHRKIKKLASEANVSINYLLKQLCKWAGEKGRDEVVRAGVGLPTWPEN
jgi:hypothetical protein